VLFTGDDFVVIDYEGEPARPLNERRYKRCPLRDVSAMLRSFHYAAAFALRRGRLRPDDAASLEPWADAWVAWVSAAYLRAYLRTVGAVSFVPVAEADQKLLLDFYSMEKCVYEVGYELNSRPEWLDIPVRGLLRMLGNPHPPAPISLKGEGGGGEPR
jgi:maltose alpha-D-glucosyltransferase/alpha-amylase